jgi:hypothetical protein
MFPGKRSRQKILMDFSFLILLIEGKKLKMGNSIFAWEKGSNKIKIGIL